MSVSPLGKSKSMETMEIEGADWSKMEQENRDPNNINDYIKVAVEDILAEPAGVHTPDCLWNCNTKLYSCGKIFCYTFCSLLCGWLAALLWGCEFGYSACCHVYCFTPRWRLMAMWYTYLQRVWAVYINCCCAPICEVCGLCLSKINVQSSNR